MNRLLVFFSRGHCEFLPLVLLGRNRLTGLILASLIAAVTAAGAERMEEGRVVKGGPPVPSPFAYQPGPRDPFVAASVFPTLVLPPRPAEPPPEESLATRWDSELARLVTGWRETWILQGTSVGVGGAGASAIVNGRIVRQGEELTVPVPTEVRGRMAELAAMLGARSGGVEAPGPDGLIVRVIAIDAEQVKFSVGGQRHGREFALARRPAVAPAAGPSSVPAKAPFVMMEKLP